MLIISLVASSLFFASCAHKNEGSIVGLSSLSALYPSRNTQDPILKLTFFELSPYLPSKGFSWDPFILPVAAGVELTQAEFLLGYNNNGQDDFIFPPSPGSCKILQKSEKYEAKKKELVSFKSASGNPVEDSNSLFLLLDADNLSSYAMVKLNKNGFANCFLPESKYRLSYNYGSQRQERLIDTTESSSPILIDFKKKGLLKIDPTELNSIQNGDSLRIGREIEIKQENDKQENIYIPKQIDSDLFKPSNFQSRSLGVDEIFQPTIFIGSNPFQIRLDAGKYVIAVLRKNAVICLQKIVIQENEVKKLGCTINKSVDLEEKLFSKNDFQINFDATFYPERLNQEFSFQNWFLQNNNSYVPIVQNEIKLESNSGEEKKYSFLFSPAHTSQVRQYPRSFSFSINDKDHILPIFGTGLDKIAQYHTPFSRYTSIQFQYPLEHPSQLFLNTYLNVSNGTDLILFEPFLSRDGILSSLGNQRFRFRVRVPRWNSTNIVEMNINGKLYRRWILDRGDISQPFSVSLEENTFQEKDFTIRLSAWGEEPLPDFIYGAQEQMPYARTRDYFVAILGK